MREPGHVVVDVSLVEKVPPTNGQANIESQRPMPVDPRGCQQRFGVVEKRAQPDLSRIVGLVPRVEPSSGWVRALMYLPS
jgi:hypothetical protein